MTKHGMIHTLDDPLLKAILARNITNSQRVIAGEFEHVLSDIIQQFERFGGGKNEGIAIPELTHRIARAFCQGFAGLPPNGFEFATWLWDVAPLHFVRLPHDTADSVESSFQHGVIHLRKLAAMVLGFYVKEQPQKAASMVPLLDASVDWVNARHLIIYALREHFVRSFDEEYAFLLACAFDKHLYRKLLPLEVAAGVIPLDAPRTARALGLVRPTFEAVADEGVARGIAFALRAAAFYGIHDALAEFLESFEDVSHPEVHRLFAAMMQRSRGRWNDRLADAALEVFRSWVRRFPEGESTPLLESVLGDLEKGV
ncbi:MAG: hypothetical protein QHI48_12495 [Bacteroidota bacterium]|nr:hypothetical protein [Bacteroidota bacterium]